MHQGMPPLRVGTGLEAARIRLPRALLLLVLVLFGCPRNEGFAGGPCYPNGTCNAGLDCVMDVCVAPVGSDAAPDTGLDAGGVSDAGSDASAGDASADASTDASTPEDVHGERRVCGWNGLRRWGLLIARRLRSTHRNVGRG